MFTNKGSKYTGTETKRKSTIRQKAGVASTRSTTHEDRHIARNATQENIIHQDLKILENL